MGWQHACRQHVETTSLDSALPGILAAFGGAREPVRPSTAWGDWLTCTKGEFRDWERAGLEHYDGICAALVERVAEDTDLAAGEYYARRLRCLVDALGKLAEPGRVLRLGVLARITEVLGDSQRRSSRVRDVIDFYYSYGSVLHHHRPGLPAPCDLARAPAWRPVSAGVEYAQVSGVTTTGPMRANLLRARGVRLEMVHRDDASVSFDAFVTRSGAVAGISGGYTLCSTMDLEPPSGYADPVGLLVNSGVVVQPPVFDRASLLQGPGGIEIRTLGLVGVEVRIGDWRCLVGAHNDPAALASEPVTFNRTSGRTCPRHDGRSLVLLGRRLLHVGQGAVDIPKAGLVLTVPPGQAPAGLPEGAQLQVDYRFREPVASGMAGGPMLLDEGTPCLDLAAEEFTPAVPPYTFAADETNDHNLLPRMVAGVTESGDLILVAIDGRNFTRGIGLTLGQCADLLAGLGCYRGMNLDGGDSKRMVVDGRIVDLPAAPPVWVGQDPEADVVSLHSGARPVHTAILLHPEG